MKSVQLADGSSMPALGMGTWRIGESTRARQAEMAAVRKAIELGYRLFDTAEMYGEGGAETVLGLALAEAMRAGDVRRDELCIVSKVYPHNASRTGTVAACERSLKRLALDHIDLYLLHWPGSHPLVDTVQAFEALRGAAKIRRWGVSNFDVDEMQALWVLSDGAACATNQVWYSASRRGAEFDLLPWLQQHGLPLMAYSPIDQASLASDRTFASIGRRLGCSAAQAALAWVMRSGQVIAIPKSVTPQHLQDNLGATEVVLDDASLREIDAAFAPPRRKTGLAIN